MLFPRIVKIFSLLAMLCLAAVVAAQDAPADDTAAPAPVAQATETVNEPAVVQDPFIQSDLSILSGNVQRPNGIFWHNGNLYVSCNGDWTIYEIDAESGSTATYLWGVRNAHALHVEDDENGGISLWIPDFQKNELTQIYQRSTRTIAADLEGPWGIDTHEEGFLITNLLGNTVAFIDREGNGFEAVQGLRSPAGIVTDGDAVYVANNGSARRAIEWFEVDSISEGTPLDAANGDVQSLITGLQNPTGLVMGPDEQLYIAYSLGTRGVIGRVDPQMCRENGGCTNDEVEIVVYTDLAAPLAGLAISPDMRLFVHTLFSPDIYYADLDDGERTAVRR